MSFATAINIATILLCLAVLVQSVRMMRALRIVKAGALTPVVSALDTSTAQARIVLGELKVALGDCSASARAARQAGEIAEELHTMIGIADSTAERLVEAASEARRSAAEAREEGRHSYAAAA